MNIGHNNIGDEGVLLILELLSKYSPSIHLEYLGLWSNYLWILKLKWIDTNITNDGTQRFAPFLSNIAVDNLDLSKWIIIFSNN